MSTTLDAAAPGAASRRTALWHAGLALLIGTAGLLLVFWPECRAAYGIWMESTAYGHCLLVAPIAAYLAWERRHRLRGLLPRPTPLFLPLAIPGIAAWLAAERLGIMEGRQLAALGFLELLFLCVLGWRMCRVLLAPLAYLVFLVPFGAFVTPVLQAFTAHFIDVGLSVLGVSHYVNDMVIEIAAGTFYVAEACAGLRFLIAAIAFGVFYALLNYRSPGRRLFFIALSVAVPIVANGIRALGIVYLGHILGSAEAAAADHVIYGWVFFSFVMLLLVLIGLPLREDPAMPGEAPTAPPPTTTAPAPAAIGGRGWVAAALLLLAAAGPAAAAALDRSAGTAAFAAVPAPLAPPTCTVQPGARTAGTAFFRLECPKRSWSLAYVVAPPRSTAAALADARARLIGPVGAEDATTTPLRGIPPEAGGWQLTLSREPELIAASATWIHGIPAPGGLRQRLVQARDSLGGNAIPPLMIAIVDRPTSQLGDAELEAAQAELRDFLSAQGDLGATVAKLVGAP